MIPRTSDGRQGTLSPWSCGWLLSDKLELVEWGKEAEKPFSRKPTRVISSRFCGHLGFVTSLVWGGGPPEEWQMLLFFLTGSVSNGSDKSFSSLMGTGLVVALDSTG